MSGTTPTTAFAAYGTEGGRPLRNATPRSLCAFLAASAAFGLLLPRLLFGGQDPSRFTCAPGSEYSGWCDPNALDVAVTDAVVVAPKATGLLSHAFTFVASPAVGISSMVRLRSRGTLAPDLAIYSGTQLVSFGLNSMSKKFSRRQRPCYHFGRQNETEAVILRGQEWVSFYSGDTSCGFSLYAAALALVAARGWRTQARTLSKVGGAVASIGSFLRIVGFMHWFTDVLVGVIFGVAVGFWLPTLLFSAEPPKEAFANAFGFRSQADGAPGGDGAGGLLLSNEATRPSGSAESAAGGDSDVP
jgi:hypothetical protein